MPTANETFASRKPGGNASLADELARQQAVLASMTVAQRAEKFGYSSFDVGDYIMAYDALGQAKMRIGTQADGTLGVLYANGDPPPKVSPPVLAPRELAIAVYWDGTFADGKARPGDVVRVDIHMAKTPGFTPTPITACGSLTAEGIELLPADNTTHYLKLVAVTSSDVIGPPSEERLVLPLGAQSLAAGAVGAVQLAAQIVLSTEIIVGTPTAGRIHIDGRVGAQQGIRMYSPGGSETVTMDAGTGEVTIRGSFRTGDTGVRIIIPARDEDATGFQAQSQILFFPSSGDNFAGILAAPDTAGAIQLTSGKSGVGFATLSMFSNATSYAYRLGSGDSVAGILQLFPDGAELSYGGYSGFIARDYGVQISSLGNVIMASTNSAGDLVGYMAFSRGANGDYIQYTNRSIGFVYAAELEANTPGIAAINVLNGLGVLMAAGAFRTITSEAAHKTNITDIPFDSVAAIRNAPAKEWQYRPERVAGDVAGRHIGPMVDDLPEQLVCYSEKYGGKGINMNDQIGVMWDAIARLADRLDLLEPA